MIVGGIWEISAYDITEDNTGNEARVWYRRLILEGEGYGMFFKFQLGSVHYELAFPIQADTFMHILQSYSISQLPFLI